MLDNWKLTCLVWYMNKLWEFLNCCSTLQTARSWVEIKTIWIDRRIVWKIKSRWKIWLALNCIKHGKSPVADISETCLPKLISLLSKTKRFASCVKQLPFKHKMSVSTISTILRHLSLFKMSVMINWFICRLIEFQNARYM